MPQHTHTMQSSITSRMTRKAHAHSTSLVVASAVEPCGVASVSSRPSRSSDIRKNGGSGAGSSSEPDMVQAERASERARRALPLAPRRGGYPRPSRSSKRAPRFCHQGQSRCSSEAWSVT